MSSDLPDALPICRPNNDSEIGALIAEAMKKVSKDGVITIEEAKGISAAVSL